MRVCCHGNEAGAQIAIKNPPNSAQLEGTSYYSPKLHPGPCSSVAMRRGSDGRGLYSLHFSSAMPHAKCSYRDVLLIQQLLPVIRSIAGDGVFQQDNASAHSAHDTAEVCAARNPFINPHTWPAASQES